MEAHAEVSLHSNKASITPKVSAEQVKDRSCWRMPCPLYNPGYNPKGASIQRLAWTHHHLWKIATIEGSGGYMHARMVGCIEWWSRWKGLSVCCVGGHKHLAERGRSPQPPVKLFQASILHPVSSVIDNPNSDLVQILELESVHHLSPGRPCTVCSGPRYAKNAVFEFYQLAKRVLTTVFHLVPLLNRTTSCLLFARSIPPVFAIFSR